MKKALTISFKKMLLIAGGIFILSTGMAEDLQRIRNMEGTWRFTVGDDPGWSAPGFDDSGWDFVKVPGSWESNGFIGYNGYGWYRKSFRLDRQIDREYVFLLLGTIDDVDEVYLNGKLIGTTGIFPVLMSTAYNVPRKYPVPVGLLNTNGDNVIAIRVYDGYLDGGIMSGPIGLYYDAEESFLSQDLSGYWEFDPVGADPQIEKPIYNKKEDEIFVPGFWESLGYKELDGYASYRKNFYLEPNIDAGNNLYLVLGYIDDQDEVFLNGQKIGEVEDINRGNSNYYRIFRGYEIPEGLLKTTGQNALEVIVYDNGGLGGIYEGPIGIATRENYKKLKNKQEKTAENYWNEFFRMIFD